MLKWQITHFTCPVWLDLFPRRNEPEEMFTFVLVQFVKQSIAIKNCLWAQRLIGSHRHNRLEHYHTGNESPLLLTGINRLWETETETEREVEEISSYLPIANTIKFTPWHNLLELIKPTKLQVMPVMKPKKKSAHVYLRFCSHHEGQYHDMHFNLLDRSL